MHMTALMERSVLLGPELRARVLHCRSVANVQRQVIRFPAVVRAPIAFENSARKLCTCSVPLKPRICYLDLDTFFVSVERLFRPELVGQPVVVGATPGKRGVVTAASYEVHAFGVHSGIPIAEAYRLAPHAVREKLGYDTIRLGAAGERSRWLA